MGYTAGVTRVEPRPSPEPAAPPPGAGPEAAGEDTGGLAARLAEIERELVRLRAELGELAAALGVAPRELAQG